MNKKRVLIDVQQQDINRGAQFSPCQCPIARAIKRKYAVTDDIVSVSPYSATVATKEGEPKVVIQLPKRAKEFIRTFDSGGRHAVEPFRFYGSRTK